MVCDMLLLWFSIISYSKWMYDESVMMAMYVWVCILLASFQILIRLVEPTAMERTALMFLFHFILLLFVVLKRKQSRRKHPIMYWLWIFTYASVNIWGFWRKIKTFFNTLISSFFVDSPMIELWKFFFVGLLLYIHLALLCASSVFFSLLLRHTKGQVQANTSWLRFSTNKNIHWVCVLTILH